MQSDMNQLILCGPSTWCKEWPFNGKEWSTFCFRIDIGDRHSVFVDVPLDVKTIEKPAYKKLKSVVEAKSGTYIMVNGILVEKPDPKNPGATRLSIKAGLSGIGIISNGAIPMNKVYVSGDIEIPQGAPQGAYTIKTSYRNVKTNSYAHRKVPVMAGSAGMPPAGEKALVAGRIMAKLPNGEEKIYVAAESMFSFETFRKQWQTQKVEEPDFV